MRYLVRHADAGDKRLWTGPDDERPLSEGGQREAEGLIAMLAGRPIAEILSSPAVRCWQTVEPLAEQRRLPIRKEAALAADADIGLAVALVLDPRCEDAVLCTHGELIRPLLDRLRELGAPIGQEASWPKGSIWLLDTVDGRVRSARFMPPLRLEDPR